jgi:L-asparaginase
MKDSRSLTPDDLKKITVAVDSSLADKILITHGTYTMPDTARYIEQNMKKKKAVVLTGSMIPLKGYDMSDASFNLGFALATLQRMDPGILLAMHGRTFEPSEVAKNMAEGRFFSIKQ